jgi:hypothetical protein
MYGQTLTSETLTGNIFRDTGGPATAAQINDATFGRTGFVVTNIRGSLSGAERYILSFASPALAQSAVDNRWSLLTIQGTRVGQPAGYFFVTSVRLATSGAVAQVRTVTTGGVTSTDRPRETAPRVGEDPTVDWRFTPPPPEDDDATRRHDVPDIVESPTIPTAPAVTPTTGVKPAAAPADLPALGDVPWWMFAAAAAAFVMLRR